MLGGSAAWAREDVCRILAACYYQPDPAFSEEGMFDVLAKAAANIHPDLAIQARQLGEAFEQSAVEDLLLDYTRLFLGPAVIPAKPYGSFWLEGALMGDTTLAVCDLYREGGFDLDEEFKELPDHIAVELEFLYLLIFRKAQMAEEADRLEQVGDLTRRFLSEHLGRWISPFASAVRENAQSAFYKQVATLTELFVNMESRAHNTALNT